MRARFIDFPKYSCIIGRIWLTLTKSLESVVFIEKTANFSLKLLIFRDFCKHNILIIKYLTIEFYFLSSTKAQSKSIVAMKDEQLKKFNDVEKSMLKLHSQFNYRAVQYIKVNKDGILKKYIYMDKS